jgi:hypothetical protein
MSVSHDAAAGTLWLFDQNRDRNRYRDEEARLTPRPENLFVDITCGQTLIASSSRDEFRKTT